jgi:hypothetical protein
MKVSVLKRPVPHINSSFCSMGTKEGLYFIEKWVTPDTFENWPNLHSFTNKKSHIFSACAIWLDDHNTTTKEPVFS